MMTMFSARHMARLLRPAVLVSLTIASPIASGAKARHATAPVAAGSNAPGVLWRFVTGGRQIITAPVVGPDGTIYAASSDGALYAVSASGHRVWSLRTGVTTGETPPARPAVGPDGTSYWNLRGAVVAITRDGRVRWVFLASGGGSPVLSRGRVLFAAGPYLYAINTTGHDTGQAAWRAAIRAASAATGSPSLAVGPDGTAYVTSPDGFLYAIATDGLRRWAFRAAQPGAAVLFSPAVGLDRSVYLDTYAGGHGTLYAIAPDGHERWRLTIAAGSDLVRGPDGTVYAATHMFVAVSPRGHILWQRAVDASAPPIAQPDGTVVVPTLSPPSLVGLDRRGTMRWRVALPATVSAPLAFGTAGRLYAGDYTGALVALAPGARGGQTIQGAAPGGPTADLGADNPPFIARGGQLTWRVTLTRTVERSTDGRRWQTVLTPGVSVADQHSRSYRNARYADVAFLAVDPHSPSGLYVGSIGALGDYLSGGAGGADGGLYYSANGASGWQSLNSGLPYTYEPRLRVPTFGLDSLVFDPARRGVLYAQTPEVFGSPGHDAGLYKSADGGRHWRSAMRGLQALSQGNELIGAYRAYPPGSLLVDRTQPDVLFLVTTTGFYRSTDGAAHWRRIVGVAYSDPASVTVRIGARGAVRVYADRGIFVSGDYGAHWRRSSQ